MGEREDNVFPGRYSVPQSLKQKIVQQNNYL